MLPNLPVSVSAIFIATTLLTLGLYYWVLKNRKGNPQNSGLIIGGMALWLALQGWLGHSLFYTKGLDQIPPRMLLLLGPILILVTLLFTTRKGRNFLDSLPLYELTWVNIIRIPVEIGLYWLALGKAVPELMSFAGKNFDIIGGLTAPFIAWFGIKKSQIGKNALLVWNIAMLGLLLNIIFHAILSVPTPFQQFGFEQPNVALLHFPYGWLPAFLAPIVLFGHLVSIRQLLGKKN